MKKILLLILLLIPLVSASLDDLNINMINAPQSVTPGTIFTLQLKVENTGLTDLNDVTFTLEEDDPFEIDNNEIHFNTIPAQSSVLLNFNIKIDSDAKSGFEELELTYETPTKELSKIFNINIQAIETTLVVISVTSEPEKIEPGSEAQVKIRVKNKASVSLKDITIKLDLTSENLPFAPLTSVTEQTISSLNKNQETELIFNIISLANAEAKIYKIPLQINYFDEQSNKYTKSDVISLIINAEPVLDYTIEESKLIENQKSTLTIKIVNKGLTDAKFLNIKLQQGAYQVLSPNTIYIGNIDSDDYETIDFTLIPNQNIQLPLTITYKDANNNDYTKNIFLTPKVHSLKEAKQLGLIKTSRILFITPIILIILIYIAYRKLRKK